MTPCESLATKAELQELRDQINTLLGQKEDGSGQVDVLQQGALVGTVLGGTVVLAQDAIQDIALDGVSDPKIWKDLASGKAQWMKVKGSGARTALPDLNKLSRTTGVNRSITNVAAKTTKLAGAGLGNVAAFTTAIGGAAISIATLKVLGARIDAQDKAINGFDRDYNSLINLVSEQNSDLNLANQKLASNEASFSQQRTEISNLTLDLDAANNNIQQLKTTVSNQETAMSDMSADLEALAQELQTLEAEANEEVAELGSMISELQQSVSEGQEIQIKLQETVDSLEENVFQLQLQNAVQDERIRGLEIVSTIWRGDLITLKADIEEDKELTDARINLLESKLILAENKTRRAGGGGVPVALQEATAVQQNKTLELASKLASSDEPLPEITYPEIANNTSPFKSIFDSLLPKIDPNNANMNQQQLDEFRSDLTVDLNDVISTSIMAGLTPTLLQLTSQTSQPAIASGVEQGICQSLNNPASCGVDADTQGLKGMLKAIGDILNAYNAALNSAILPVVVSTNTIVQSMNNFMRVAWETTRMGKVLQILNTALALHNAAYLSTNVAASMGDIISQLSNNLISLVTKEDKSPININETLGRSMQQFLQTMLGTENYQGFITNYQKYSRILNSAANIVNAIEFSMAGLAEGLEIVGNYTGKIGNALKKSGQVLESSYQWMNEKFSVNTGRLGRIRAIVDGLEQAENVASDFLTVSEEAKEITENIANIRNDTTKIRTELDLGEKSKEETENTTKASSRGAQPSQSDFTPDSPQ